MPDTSEQLVDLVADIARYLEFLPWCVGARIPARAGNRVKADLAIGFTVKDSASVV